MPDQLSTEIGASLASVWARYVGARPTSASVDFDGSTVRWAVDGGTNEFEEAMATPETEAGGDGPPRTTLGYARETSAAVSKATHRRVSARLSEHNKETGVATETFILERAHHKY
jgi:hypothetical protein